MRTLLLCLLINSIALGHGGHNHRHEGASPSVPIIPPASSDGAQMAKAATAMAKNGADDALKDFNTQKELAEKLRKEIATLKQKTKEGDKKAQSQIEGKEAELRNVEEGMTASASQLKGLSVAIPKLQKAVIGRQDASDNEVQAWTDGKTRMKMEKSQLEDYRNAREAGNGMMDKDAMSKAAPIVYDENGKPYSYQGIAGNEHVWSAGDDKLSFNGTSFNKAVAGTAKFEGGYTMSVGADKADSYNASLSAGRLDTEMASFKPTITDSNNIQYTYKGLSDGNHQWINEKSGSVLSYNGTAFESVPAGVAANSSQVLTSSQIRRQVSGASSGRPSVFPRIQTFLERIERR
ncbi:hypothetical protein K2X33_10730 [bacterium]|nr:hypothetical protein [bacterium]